MTGPVKIDNGKYTFLVPDGDYRVHVLRHGEPWLIIEQGCSAIQSLIQEVERLTTARRFADWHDDDGQILAEGPEREDYEDR